MPTRPAESAAKGAGTAKGTAKGVPVTYLSTRRRLQVLAPLVQRLGVPDLDRYEMLKSIGKGTFGEVWKALAPDRKTYVAIKKLEIPARTTTGFAVNILREFRILQQITHPNILPILELVPEKDLSQAYTKGDVGKVDLVLPFMDHDMSGIINNPKIRLRPALIKYYLKEILHGIEFLHSSGIIHRDLKSANILVSNNGDVRLADFGLARRLTKDPKMTAVVVTLWFRAPELLLGDRCYTAAIDMWSVGCIFGEMLSGHPLFPGKKEVDTLDRIFRLCGTPSAQDWSGMSLLPNVALLSPKETYPSRLREQFQALESCDDHALALLGRLLTLDPTKRITASEALQHPYFWRDPQTLTREEHPQFPSSYEMFHRYKEPAKDVSRRPETHSAAKRHKH